jgi:hypothetical protein
VNGITYYRCLKVGPEPWKTVCKYKA